MRRGNKTLAVLLALACPAAAGAQGGTPARHYEVERLAPGVYAVVRQEPQGPVGNANSLIAVRPRDVVVVDAQFTREATLEVLHLIRGLTRNPVSFVINTHWHDDHVAGNQVYRDTFPGVQFVAQANTREDLRTLGARNRVAQVQGAPGALTRFRSLLERGLGLDGAALSPSARAALESTIRIASRYVQEAPGFRETLPTLTFSDRLTLEDDSVPVELHWFGPANTRGDAIVRLPRQGIVATGDVLAAPIPFAFDVDVSGWIQVLARVDSLGATTFLPGHGPVLRGDSQLRVLAELLSAVRDSTAAAAAGGATLEEARTKVKLTAFRRRLAGGDPWLGYLFDGFFLAPAVAAAYGEPRRG